MVKIIGDKVFVVLEWMKRQRDYAEIYYLNNRQLSNLQEGEVEVAIKKKIPDMNNEIDIIVDDSNKFIFCLTSRRGIYLPETV